MAEGRRIGVAALVLAASQVLSLGLGFVRDAVLAALVGRGAATDAYQAAFQIPDILNYFLAGGALSIAFIPLYTRARERQGEEAAARLLAKVLGTLTVLAGVATVALFWFARDLVELAFPAFDASQQALTARLTRIVLPAQICFVTGGIVRAALMARGRFAAQAAAPLIYNAGIIAGGVLGADLLGVEGFAWGALLGALAGPLGASVWEARGRISLHMRWAPLDAEFRHYLLVAAPLMVGVTLLTVDEWYDRYFGQFLAVGSIATLVFARRLMRAPVAIVGQAVATAALPGLARLFEAGRHDELGAVLLRTLQATLGVAVLLAAGTAVLAEPLVTLVYVRGLFSPADAVPVATALLIFSAAVPGWVVQQVAVRGFYARGDTWRPMLLGTAVALAALPLYARLGAEQGVPGLAAAGALAVSTNALATLLLARHRHGAPQLLPLLLTLLRSLAVAAPSALAGSQAARLAAGRLPGPSGDALAQLAAGGLAFVAVAAVLVPLLADAALRETLAKILRRLARRGE
jgi:putative peptidoglycan lipid II flippase